MKKIFTFLSLLTACAISAQTNIVVKDSVSGKPIPYVNFWIENENTVLTSDENGELQPNIQNDKSFILYAIGFETKRMSKLNSDIIFLKPIAHQLDEAHIISIKNKEEKEIGYYDSGGFRYRMNYFFNSIFFNISKENREKYPFIKGFKFNTLSKIKNAKIRIYLVEVNEDGSPSEKLLSNVIILEVKKGNCKNIVDLSEERILIPENGFFIVFEKLKIEQNKYKKELRLKDKNGKKLIKTHETFQPEIALTPINEEIGWNKRRNNKWEKSAKTSINNPNSYESFLMKKYHNKYLVPSVNVTVSN